MKFLFLGRQPVMDDNRSTIAYALRFQSKSLKHKLMATNYVASLSQLIHSFDIKKSLEGYKGWVRVDTQALKDADLTLLPKEYLTFELVSRKPMTEFCFDKIEQLKSDGYEFVVDHTVASDVIKQRGFEYLNNFKAVMFEGRKGDSYSNTVKAFRSRGVDCAVRNVMTFSNYLKYKTEGFNLFMGSYFKEAQPIKGHKLSSAKLTLLQILGLLRSDVEMPKIVEAIKFSPDISLQLLQFINSAHIQTTTAVESIEKCVSLLGRDKLTSWVIFSLYSAQSDGIPQALIDVSLTRAHTMELICELLKLDRYKDQAFLVGLLSVSDTIFKVYLHVVIRSGSFSQVVQDALLDDVGDLAKVLRIAKILEEGNYKKMEIISSKLKVPVEKFSEQLEKIYAYVYDAKKSFGTVA